MARWWFSLARTPTIRAIKRAGVLFIHIPRTGGTSICQRLYGRNIPHASLGFYRSLGIDAIDTLPSFSIVRDPVSRARSAYRFIRHGGTDLVACSRYDPLGLTQCETFDLFADRIRANPGMIRQYDVLRPQSDFLVAPSRPVDRLFAYHRGLFDDPALRHYLGSCPIGHLNASDGTALAVSASARAAIEAVYAKDVATFRAVMDRGRLDP